MNGGIVALFALLGAGAAWAYPVYNASPFHYDDDFSSAAADHQALERLEQDTATNKIRRAEMGAIVGGTLGVAWCARLAIKSHRIAN